MKICLVGAYGHNCYVFRGAPKHEDADIVGIAPGPHEQDLAGLMKESHAAGYEPKLFDDYRKMFDEVKPDVVSVACCFCDHAKVSIEAMQRDINVFIEKPVALTMEDLSRLKEVHKKANVHLTTMLSLRYMPWFYAAWRRVRKGDIGAVRLVTAQKSYKLGQRAYLYKKRELYGGTIAWVGSHGIDLVLWFSGESFESVFASHSAQYNRGHGELEVSALCQFTLSNEVLGSVSIDYLRPPNAPTHGDDRVRVVGTEGVVEVRSEKAYLINGEAEGVRELEPEKKGDGHIFSDFLGQIKGETTSLASPEDAFRMTEACLRARQSADERKVVFFD